MKNLRERLKEVGEKFGINITPENVDDIVKQTWKKYYEKTNKTL